MIYVYAITGESPSPQTLGGAAGVFDAPLESRTVGRVAAVYSEVHRVPRPTRETAWRHEKVVERVMAAHPVLPARFGTVFRDLAALDDVLARNDDVLAAGLNRVRGCVELGVRVAWDADAAAAAEAAAGPGDPPHGAEEMGPGRAYLAARMEQERGRRRIEAQAAALAENLNRLFFPCAKDGVVRVLPMPQFVMAAAYLVPRERVAEFRSRVREAGTAFQALRLLCTGPWPPYHFVPELSVPPAATEVLRA